MQLLKNSHRDENLNRVMCRSTLSIDWQGYVYDCDFNQMLDLPLGGTQIHLRDLADDSLQETTISIGEHCYGCTAGQGSSCGGALQS
jgi:MoaA/NifB/PqqE/SkfB family radical SAM enzyme